MDLVMDNWKLKITLFIIDKCIADDTLNLINDANKRAQAYIEEENEPWNAKVI